MYTVPHPHTLPKLIAVTARITNGERRKVIEFDLNQSDNPLVAIRSLMSRQFPDYRLIDYNCN